MGLPALAVAAVAGGQILQGFAEKRAAEGDEAVAKYNAAVAEQEAKQIEARSTVESVRQAEEASRRRSAMLADIGLTGAVATEGAPLLVQARQQTEDELDNLMVGYDARVAASAKRSQAEAFRMEAKAAKGRGRAAVISGFVGAASTVALAKASSTFPKSTATSPATPGTQNPFKSSFVGPKQARNPFAKARKY